MSDVFQTITGGFFDSVNKDRLYSADQMNMPYKRIVTEGIFAHASDENGFKVSASSGMTVDVAPGNALIGEKWAENEETVSVEIAVNTGESTRIDSIILRCDRSIATRAVGIVYRQGTTTAPDLEQTDDVAELRLANISVGVNATAITNSNIIDTRGDTECPWATVILPRVKTKSDIPHAFDTVAAMAAADNLEDGLSVRTGGFRTLNDGGGAWYSISDTGSANGKDVIALEGDLYGILEESEAFINVADFGADLTGTEDSSEVIQYVIDKYPKHCIYFPNGQYKLLTTVKTWPDNNRYVNLVFAKNAVFFTPNNLDCLFYLGGYDLDANYGTTATLGYKKFFVGGQFNGANCAYAVKAASGVCDLQVMNCLFYGCNSGLLIGHAQTDRSTDSVVAYCNFIGTSAADSFGVRYMKADNKIQHCRIYGFETAISSMSGGLYAFDIHTLDLSETPAGYDCDDSCCVDLSEGGGRNTLIAVYGNGEGTFLRLNGDNINLIKLIGCEYRNWTLSNSNFVFVDILGTLHGVHLVATGNTVIADDPGNTVKVRYGIRGPIYDFSLANNILWGTEYFTDRGDLLMQSMESPYMPTANQTMTPEWWYYIGSMKLKSFANAYYIAVTFSLFSFVFKIFASSSTLSTTTLYSRQDIHLPENSIFRLGFKKNGDTVDWYLASEAATPTFPCIAGLVSEDGNKEYYLSNIYKYRNTESAYSQKGLGGSFTDFSVDKYFTITNAT